MQLEHPSLLIPYLKVTGVCWAPQAGAVQASRSTNRAGRKDVSLSMLWPSKGSNYSLY